jgi:hypothetical protein
VKPVLALVLIAAALLAPLPGLAAKAPTQKQYAEQKLKAAMTAWAKKNVAGLRIGTVSCVLPLNGNVVHCTVHASAPRSRENIVFTVRETLTQLGAMKWAVTSDACSDSKTGQKLSCG